VWIGGGAIILPGITIEDDAIIGAASVVTRNVAAGAIARGNPARVGVIS
jgi:maltose O-acetyltransferase